MVCVRQTELLQHICTDPVRPQNHPIRAVRGTGVADRVVHVGARVVGDRAGQVAVERHAMHEQPIVGRERGQPSPGGCVLRPFAHVHVDADAQPVSQIAGRGQRLVGTGEGGMDTYVPAAAAAQVALVLGQTTASSVGHGEGNWRAGRRLGRDRQQSGCRVAVGHAVTRVYPHAHFGARGGDHLQAAFDGVGALVMVDDARGAPLERFERAELGRPLDHLEVERAVEAPPHLFENLAEPAGLDGRRRHAPSQCRVQVMVGAHESGSGGRHLRECRSGSDPRRRD